MTTLCPAINFSTARTGRSARLNNWALGRLTGATGEVRDRFSIEGDASGSDSEPLYTWTTPDGEIFHEEFIGTLKDRGFSILLYRQLDSGEFELVEESVPNDMM